MCENVETYKTLSERLMKEYEAVLVEGKQLLGDIEFAAKRDGKIKNTKTLELSIHLNEHITKAQQDVLIYRGILAVLKSNDPDELSELNTYIKKVSLAGVIEYGKILKLPHTYLIDLLDLQKQLQEVHTKYFEMFERQQDLKPKGRQSNLTGNRSTYHHSLEELIPELTTQLTVGVTKISGTIETRKDNKYLNLSSDDLSIDRVLQPIELMIKNGTVGQFRLMVDHKDPVHDCVIEIKNHPSGTFNYRIQRRGRNNAIDLLNLIEVTLTKDSSKDLIDLSLLRTYLKAHLNLFHVFGKGTYMRDRFDSVRTKILSIYNQINCVDYVRYDTGTGLQDPLSVISLIHQQHGRLIVEDGHLRFKKEYLND